MNSFDKMFATALGITRPPISKRLPMSELIGCCTNGHPGVGHVQCGCPGLVSMLPCMDGTWMCSNCDGHATKEDAEVKMAEGLEEFNKLMSGITILFDEPKVKKAKKTKKVKP